MNKKEAKDKLRETAKNALLTRANSLIPITEAQLAQLIIILDAILNGPSDDD